MDSNTKLLIMGLAAYLLLKGNNASSDSFGGGGSFGGASGGGSSDVSNIANENPTLTQELQNQTNPQNTSSTFKPSESYAGNPAARTTQYLNDFLRSTGLGELLQSSGDTITAKAGTGLTPLQVSQLASAVSPIGLSTPTGAEVYATPIPAPASSSGGGAPANASAGTFTSSNPTSQFYSAPATTAEATGSARVSTPSNPFASFPD